MELLHRRSALKLGLAAAVATNISPAYAAPSPLTATVTLGGKTFQFRQESGQELGDFVSEIGGFTQRCIRCEVAGCPLTVYFRPDRDSDRAEVVFELGQLFDVTPANLGAYTVVIARGGAVLATIPVPHHYWFSRWRWQSAPRKVVRTAQSLIASNLLPPYAQAEGGQASLAAQSATASAAASSSGGEGGVFRGQLVPMQIVQTYPLSLKVGQRYTFSIDAPRNAQVMMAVASNANWLAYSVSNGETGTTLSYTPTQATSFSLIVASMNAVGGAYAIAMTPFGQQQPPAPTNERPSPTPSLPSSYSIMGLAGLTASMPRTGERDDIGVVTEPQGEYLCTGSPTALGELRAQAEAAGTIPWHMRDENTGAPLNFYTYPQATWYDRPSKGALIIRSTSTPIDIDSAHQPAVAYVPYLLTGDPYHLEDLQFQATWNWGAAPHNYRLDIVQARAFAWSLRTLAQAARVTPQNSPSWLLPRTYWLNLLNTVREFFEENYVNSSRPERARFRAVGNINSSRDEAKAPAGTWVDPWQDDFVATVLGFVVSMGFGEWRDAFDWCIGSVIARTSGRSGWVRAHASPYRMILRRSKEGAIASSWTEAWEITKSVAKLTVDDPDSWESDDMAPLGYIRGALGYAQRLGTADVRENIAWAERQIEARNWTIPYKWRMATA